MSHNQPDDGRQGSADVGKLMGRPQDSSAMRLVEDETTVE